MLTSYGEQADQARRWAWEDPAARVSMAMARCGELSRLAEGDEQAQREIGDSVRMLSRLAGTLVHDGPSILDQLGDTR
jgi:hypothetical protein